MLTKITTTGKRVLHPLSARLKESIENALQGLSPGSGRRDEVYDLHEDTACHHYEAMKGILTHVKNADKVYEVLLVQATCLKAEAVRLATLVEPDYSTAIKYSRAGQTRKIASELASYYCYDNRATSQGLEEIYNFWEDQANRELTHRL